MGDESKDVTLGYFVASSLALWLVAAEVDCSEVFVNPKCNVILEET